MTHEESVIVLIASIIAGGLGIALCSALSALDRWDHRARERRP